MEKKLLINPALEQAKISANRMYEEARHMIIINLQIQISEIPEEFFKYLHKALMHCSIHKIGCEMVTWLGFIKMDRPLFWAELELATKVLKGATPHEMGQSFDENINMIERYVYPVVKSLHEAEVKALEPTKREIQAKLTASMSLPVGASLFD